VIIITGPGRSGTSALALLYKELGFDPGGSWLPEVDAGLEHGDFWTLNNRLAAAVGMTMFHPPKRSRPRPPAALPAPAVAPFSQRAMQAARRRVVRSLTTPSPPASSPRRASQPRPRVRLADWDHAPAVVDANRETMVRLAATTPVVKDPRFLWTLPLWLAAGAQIEHVVITIRSMADMIASRDAAGHTAASGDTWFTQLELRNSLSYGLGVATAAVYDSGVSHSVIRFPDFVHDIDGLYDALRFPEPVSPARFRATARRVFDPSQVHDYSADGAAS
jgi:hypothetical protein